MKKIVMTVVAFSMLLATNSNVEGRDFASPEKDERVSLTNVTASRYITQDTYACTSKDAYDEMIRACVNDDMNHLKRMYAKGTLVVLTKGTKIDIVKREGLGVYKVQVLSGPHIDSYLFVDAESISSN